MSVTDPIPSALPRNTTRTVIIAALALAVTFAAGFVVGVVTDRVLLLHHPPRVPPMAAEMMLHRLDRHLDLSDQQRGRIEEILERHHERINQLVSGVRPQVDKEIAEANAEIERVLTPEQRRKFQELKMRLGPHMRHEGRRRREPTR